MRDIVITGAWGGMGKATVESLRQQGFRVFALDRKTGTKQEKDLIPIEVDLTSEEDVKRAFEIVSQYTDRLSAVIHFAGIYMLDSLVEMDPEQFKKIFEVNLYGVFLTNRAALPLLKPGSKIIITTSELAPLDPLPFTGIYAVTKGALDKYAYSLRMELQLLEVSVSVLRAGAVETEMLGASTRALDRFCETTALYSCNADRFKRIVNGVEARCVPPAKIAGKVLRILKRKRPRFAYSINRNPLLLLLNLLPKEIQFRIIRRILR